MSWVTLKRSLVEHARSEVGHRRLRQHDEVAVDLGRLHRRIGVGGLDVDGVRSAGEVGDMHPVARDEGHGVRAAGGRRGGGSTAGATAAAGAVDARGAGGEPGEADAGRAEGEAADRRDDAVPSAPPGCGTVVRHCRPLTEFGDVD